MPTFRPGTELAERLYREAVAPLLGRAFDGLNHSAARVGAGSDVLGHDTPRSTDHDWGPRLTLFLPDDRADLAAEVDAVLGDGLPATVAGWPTGFAASDTTALGVLGGPGVTRHGVTVTTVSDWLTGLLGHDRPARPDGPTVADWTAMPQQRLLEITGGVVCHDGLGTLVPVRRRLAWYPDPLWRHLMAAQWTKLGQEEHLVGRAAEVGDELGAALLAARQARELLRLALWQVRRYAPYGKWLGTAVARQVPDAAAITGRLRTAVAAVDAADREAGLCRAYRELARRHNALGLTAELDPRCRPFHDRPFAVLDAERFAAALRDTVTDPMMAGLPRWGMVDQWADSTDLLTSAAALDAPARELGEAIPG